MGINRWKKEPLKELCTRVGDGLHGTPKYSNSSNVPFINGNNLKNGKIQVTENTNYVTEGEYEKNFIDLNSYSLLLSINGTLGSMAFYNGEKLMLGKSAAYLNFKTDINKFQYYYFQLPGVQKYFYNVATGSTIKNLSLKSIQNFKVPVPEENEYKKIAKVLSDIDAKIEVNNKINQELEALAKTIYNYWFVQFDFPDDNGKPYNSSGGKMVYNETLKREIPEGWECGTLSDLCNRIGDGLHGTPKYIDNSNYSFINGNNLKNGFITIDSDTKNVSVEEYKKHFIELNDNSILLSINGTLGNLAIYNEEKVMLGKSSAYINCKENYKTYCYEYLNQSHMPKVFWNMATGSTIKNLGLSSLKNLRILKPEIDIILKFSEITNPIIEKRKKKFKENQKLSDLRDWLLPMLMNGQVTVGEATKEVEHLQMVAEPQTNYGKEIHLNKIAPNPYHPSAAIIGIHITKQLEDSNGMGRTKFQKVLHLTEYHCKTVLGGLYYKKTAGPYNDILLQHVEGKFRQYGHIKVSEDKVQGKRHIVYKTTHKTLEYEAAYEGNLSDNYRAKLEGLLAVIKPLSLKEAEAISTLYAVWNNRIIEGKTIEEEELIKDFYNWSSRKRKEFENEDIINAMSIMKKYDIIPEGWGDYIEETTN